jgi:hypothetical protein
LRLKFLRFAGLFALKKAATPRDRRTSRAADPDFHMEFDGLPWGLERK